MPDDHYNKGASGAEKEEMFWGEHYQEDRYEDEHGNLLPLYDRIVIEGECDKLRFTPAAKGHKSSQEDATLELLKAGLPAYAGPSEETPFDPAKDGILKKKDLPF